MPHTDPHRQHYGLTFAVLALAGAAYSLLQSLVAPALPTLQHDLHASPTTVTWILTSYLLSASVATPIFGRLGDMYGKERLLVIVLGVLAAGTLVSAVATTAGVMILGRSIQGAGGAVFPLAFGIIRDEFPPQRVAIGISFISAILGIGAGAGIVLAGPIVDNLSYHWLFWLPLVAVLVALVATVLFVPESPIKTPGRVNWTGGALLSAWLVAVLVAVSQGPTWGWGSARTLGLFAAGALLCVAWVRVEARSREPLVDMRMMRLRGVWTVNLTAFLLGAGMYCSFVLIPQFVEAPASAGYGFHSSVTAAGLFLLPSTLGMLIVSPLAGRLANAVGSKIPLVLGALLTASCFGTLAATHGQRWEFYLAAGFLGAGIGFAFAAMANLIVEVVPARQTGVATGMNTVMRTIGGSVGAQVAASILAAGAVNGVPTEHGFTIAFALAAGAVLVGVVSALVVPGRSRARRPQESGTVAVA
ncbi:MAG: MFS transporter [Thermoleophilaceae bacterium]